MGNAMKAPCVLASRPVPPPPTAALPGVAWAERPGQLGRISGVLAHDGELRGLLDRRLDVGYLVTGLHEEERVVAPNLLVLGDGHHQLLGAVEASALADDPHRLAREVG